MQRCKGVELPVNMRVSKLHYHRISASTCKLKTFNEHFKILHLSSKPNPQKVIKISIFFSRKHQLVVQIPLSLSKKLTGKRKIKPKHDHSTST